MKKLSKKTLGIICAVVLAVYAVKAVVFVVPASLIYVAVGAILYEHPVLAVGINLLGIFLEVSVTYALGKFLGKDAVYKLLSKKEAGRKILERDPRLTPPERSFAAYSRFLDEHMGSAPGHTKSNTNYLI